MTRDQNPDLNDTLSLGQAIQQFAQALQAQGTAKDQAMREAALLAESAMDLSPLQRLHGQHKPLSSFPKNKHFSAWATKYLAGMPLSRLQGQKGFYSHTFGINEYTLDPRPETELLVETACRHFHERKNESLDILELGVGSGCIILSLLKLFPNAMGVGTDISPKALQQAHQNSENLDIKKRLTFLEGSWFSALENISKTSLAFDLIISNPPYIPRHTIKNLDPAVKDHDPHLALDGGPDGLDAYREILQHAPRFLKKDGRVILEIGFDQKDAVESLGLKQFSQVETLDDLAGHPRCVTLWHPLQK